LAATEAVTECRDTQISKKEVRRSALASFWRGAANELKSDTVKNFFRNAEVTLRRPHENGALTYGEAKSGTQNRQIASGAMLLKSPSHKDLALARVASPSPA
jgi:hypothetical protein